MPLSLKHYKNIEDVKRDLGKLSKSIAATINLRDLNATNPKKSPNINKKLTNSSLDKAAQLQHNLLLLKNIKQTINSDLKSALDEASLAKLNSIVKKLESKISNDLEAKYSENRQATDDILDDNFAKLMLKLKRVLTTKLEGKCDNIELEYLSNDQNVVGYITITNLKSDNKVIDPVVVIAVSHVGNLMYANPALNKVEFPGQFQQGWPFKDLKELITIVENQLLVDNNLNLLTPKPVPITKQQLKLSHAKINKTFIATNSIIIELKDVPSPKEATEIANDLYREINNTILKIDPKNKDRILYTVLRKRAIWRVVFKFVSNKRGKDISRNLKAQEITHLRQIFNDDEIVKVRKALSGD